MIPLKQAVTSSIGRKMITALTGLGAVLFVIAHLAGNVLLYLPGSEAFNKYTESLTQLGALKEIAEVGLVVLFGLHIVNSLLLKKSNSSARGEVAYKGLKSKKISHVKSPSNTSSRNMAISGTILLIYLLIHIKHFTLGPSIAEGYVTQLPMGAGGASKDVRDLHRLVLEEFSKPGVVALYVAAMLFLGWHLRHGVWSALHSAGLTRPRTSRGLQIFGALLGLVIAAGFLGIPLYIYFFKNVG